MTNVKNYIWGGLAALAGFSLLKVSQLSNLSREFVIETSTRIHSVDFSYLTVAVDILFKNPTDARITLKHPTIAVYDSPASLSQNKPIQTSEVSGQFYTIQANAQTRLQPVYIKLPINLATLLTAFEWLKTYLRGEPVHLIGRATTTVNGIRIEKLLPVSLQKNPPVDLVLAGAAYADPSGVKVRMNLKATNKSAAAQSLTVRLSIYATETDRLVENALFTFQSTAPTPSPGRTTTQVALRDALLTKPQLQAFAGLASVLIEATVKSGSRTAQTITLVNLPAR